MEASERDSIRDWLLPGRSRPPLVGELERRIEEALATARASEAAVMTVGAVALDAAEQGRRADEVAERASAMFVNPRDPVAPTPPADQVTMPPAFPHTQASRPAPGDASLRDFSER